MEIQRVQPFSGGFAAVHEWDLLVEAGSDRLLLVGLGSGSNVDLVSNVLFNGVSSTRAVRVNNAGPSAYWYVLPAPAVGTFKLRIELASGSGINVAAIVLTDAPQTGIVLNTGGNGNGFANSPYSNSITGSGGTVFGLIHSASVPTDDLTSTGTGLLEFVANSARCEAAYQAGATAMGWSWIGGAQKNLVQALVRIDGVIGPPPPVMTGNVTTDDATPTGTLQSNPPSTLTGSITLDSAAPTGTLAGAAPGTVVLTGWDNLSGMPLPSEPVARITLQRLSDGVQVLNLAGLTTSADPATPVISITNAALVAGTIYLAIANNADGSILGVERVQAT